MYRIPMFDILASASWTWDLSIQKSPTILQDGIEYTVLHQNKRFIKYRLGFTWTPQGIVAGTSVGSIVRVQ